MNWQTTYPDLATVMMANFDTLAAWRERLPPPQTDVECTVRRRLEKRYTELGLKEIRRHEPELADKINSITDKMRAMGIPCSVERM